MSMSNARFGSKFGAKLRKRFLEVESKEGAQQCPYCGGTKAKRLAKGIFKCPKCGKFTSAAYSVENE